MQVNHHLGQLVTLKGGHTAGAEAECCTEGLQALLGRKTIKTMGLLRILVRSRVVSPSMYTQPLAALSSGLAFLGPAALSRWKHNPREEEFSLGKWHSHGHHGWQSFAQYWPVLMGISL